MQNLLRQSSLIIFLLLFGSSPLLAENWDSRKIMKPLVDGVRRFSLSNGLRVVFYRRAHAPVFSGQIWVKVGGVNEQIGQTGSAHMLEHMAFKGSKTIGTNEFSRIYEDRGASGLNAATSKDYTYYMVDLPSNAFELWAWMESDRLANPVFRQFYKEREVVTEERRMRSDDDPNGKLYEQLIATAFLTHPNRFPIIGWPSDLRNLQKATVKKLHDTYYRPDNMVVSLVGDLDLATVKKTMEKYFSRLKKPTSEVPKVLTEEEKQNGTREVVVINKALPRFAVAYHKPVYPDPDDMKFSVLHSILSEGKSSIFYRRLIEGKKMATSLNTSEAPGELYPSVFYVWGLPKKGVSNKQLIEEVEKILEELKEKEIPASDIEAAKKRIRVQLLSGMTSSHGLAETLGHTELLWGDWQKMLEMYDITFNTTAKDLMQLAKKYFTDSNKTIARLENHE